MSDQPRPPRRRLVDPHAAAPRPQDPHAAYPLDDQRPQRSQRPTPREPQPGERPTPRTRRPQDSTPGTPRRRLQDPTARPADQARTPRRRLQDPTPREAQPQPRSPRAAAPPERTPQRPRPDTTPRPYEEPARRPQSEQAWSAAPQEQRGLDGVRPARPQASSYERAGTINPGQARPRPAAQQRPARAPLPQPAAAPHPRQLQPRREKRVRRGGVGRRIGAVLLALVLVLGAVGVVVDLRLPRTDALANYAGRPGNTLGQIWLVVGSDSRAGLSPEEESALATGGDVGAGRTDTIMLLHKPWFGSATLVSLPRDSYVAIPGYGSNKINAAYAFGGPQLLVQTVEQNTGLHIDHYVEVGFGGFAATVDAVGGVEICPDEAIDDPLAGITLAAGCQKADGATALGYVRTRATAMGDFDRVARQREFMGALMQATLSPATLLNPFRLVPLVDSVTQAITVDDGDHIPSLAQFAWALRANPASVTVPIGAETSNEAGSVLLWDETAAPELFAAMKRNSSVSQELITSLQQR